jgi:hypothetical protein
MARKPSVLVQMTDDESELDQLLAAANAPRNPGPDEPDDPSPVPTEPFDPDEDDEDPEDDDDNGEAAREDQPANPGAVPSPPEGDRVSAGTDAADRANAAGSVPTEMPPFSPPMEIIPPNAHSVRYEARISIVDAYQYPGNLKDAPGWVDRNWAAYADNFDPLRQLEPGPALRVPTYRGDTVLCRVGDYVARQEVKLTADQPGEIKIEVWEKEQFQRIFMPVEKAPIRPYGAKEINRAPTDTPVANKGRASKSKSSRGRKPAKAAA